MSNPYAQMPMNKPGSGDALSKVGPPALTLMITTIVMMVLVVIGILLNLLGIGLGAAGAAAGGGPQEGITSMISGTFGMVMRLIGLAVGGFVIYGCTKMRKLESHGIALAANIVSMIPCISPCFCIGLPVGIWGLVVLLQPDVKQAFR